MPESSYSGETTRNRWLMWSLAKKIVVGVVGTLAVRAFFEACKIMGWQPETWLAIEILKTTLTINTDVTLWTLAAVVATTFLVAGAVVYARWQGRAGPILLLPPRHRYSLRWDPPQELAIIVRPILGTGEAEPLGTRMPVFRLKNLGAEPVQNVRLEWVADRASIADAARRTHKFDGLDVRVAEDTFSVRVARGDGASDWLQGIERVGSGELPYLAATGESDKTDDIAMAPFVANYVEAYLTSAMPDELYPAVATIGMNVKVSWRGEKKGGSRKFRVLAVARSVRPYSSTGRVLIPEGDRMRPPPRVMGEVSFVVKARASLF